MMSLILNEATKVKSWQIVVFFFPTDISYFLMTVYVHTYKCPVAQLVERWTPGSESPGSRRSGARYMKLLTGMARLVGAAAAS